MDIGKKLKTKIIAICIVNILLGVIFLNLPILTVNLRNDEGRLEYSYGFDYIEEAFESDEKICVTPLQFFLGDEVVMMTADGQEVDVTISEIFSYDLRSDIIKLCLIAVVACAAACFIAYYFVSVGGDAHDRALMKYRFFPYIMVLFKLAVFIVPIVYISAQAKISRSCELNTAALTLAVIPITLICFAVEFSGVTKLNARYQSADKTLEESQLFRVYSSIVGICGLISMMMLLVAASF